MSDEYELRPINEADIPTVARHRAEMFQEMGICPEELYADLVTATIDHLARAVPSGEYVGWFAHVRGRPQEVIAGAGAQLRRTLPHPRRTADGGFVLGAGRQAIVLNVYTEPEWRRKGVAKALMHHLLRWSKARGIETLVLHASDDGRPMYEGMGFEATNEMRFVPPKG